MILAKGLNFAVALKKIPVPQIVAVVENGPRHVSNAAHTAIVGPLQKPRMPPRNITPEESKALRNLQKDSSIVIVPADKDWASMVMDRSCYDRKINKLLSDQLTYKRLLKDPAPALKHRMNELLLSLKKSGPIPPSCTISSATQLAAICYCMASPRSTSQMSHSA